VELTQYLQPLVHIGITYEATQWLTKER
jgi:hypothetical protein